MGTWSREMTQYMPYRKYRQVEDIVGREKSVGKDPRELHQPPIPHSVYSGPCTLHPNSILSLSTS